MGKFNEYSQKATPADNDTLMIYDATSKSNKLSPFSGIWNWIVGKLTNAVISNLQTNNKSVVGALNELNSKALSEVRKSIWRITYYQKCTCCHSWINHNRKNNGCLLSRRFNQYWLYRDHISASRWYHCQQFGQDGNNKINQNPDDYMFLRFFIIFLFPFSSLKKG